jgi:hypothetical protein
MVKQVVEIAINDTFGQIDTMSEPTCLDIRGSQYRKHTINKECRPVRGSQSFYQQTLDLMEIPSLLMAGSLFVQALRLDLPAYKRPLLPPFCFASLEISKDLTKTGFSLLLALLPVRSGNHDRHQDPWSPISHQSYFEDESCRATVGPMGARVFWRVRIRTDQSHRSGTSSQ